MFKFPFVRYSIFCFLLLVLLFSKNFTVGVFFVVAIFFGIIEKILDVKKYDKKTGKKLIDYGWILVPVLTFAIIYIYRDYIIY